MYGNAETAGVTGAGKTFLVALTIWVLLQLPRLVAVPLIRNVAAGVDDPAWMYPAILDVVCAIAAPFLAVALWKKRGFAVWTITVVYLAVSIVDHIGAFTSLSLLGVPAAFADMSPSGGSAALAPAIQTAFDIVFLILVVQPKNRRLFFELA